MASTPINTSEVATRMTSPWERGWNLWFNQLKLILCFDLGTRAGSRPPHLCPGSTRFSGLPIDACWPDEPGETRPSSLGVFLAGHALRPADWEDPAGPR